ncbi:hypothetical protein K788_0004270 (plasmid) [Paraburkholderia caribensis MBA4]|uniref:Uncharacterized protein n=1 Tax=Paraburkholderia caribensis MBA4 TaxID=1323664 RepID=A0A0P0RP62_9BURK|nr:hypothetical protein K788_0004270 [Paraburkholderia caribensis MBA4]
MQIRCRTALAAATPGAAKRAPKGFTHTTTTDPQTADNA